MLTVYPMDTTALAWCTVHGGVPVFVLKCLIDVVKYGVDMGSDFKTVVLNRCHVRVVVV